MGQKLFVVAALIVAFVHQASAQTADEVVERALAAAGGRAAHAKLRSRRATGTIALGTPAGDMSGTVEMLNEAPNKARALIQVDLSSLGAGKLVVDQRFDGLSGYVLDNLNGNREITGNQLETMRGGSFPNPLLNYKQLGATVTLAGREKVGDRDAHVLIYEPTSGSPTRFFIDAETHVVLKVVVKLDVPQFGGEIEQTTTFSDYRDVDGVKLPFRLQTTSSVQNFTITFTTVEHNVPIDPALFVKPPAK
jgi:zinc protease